MMGFGLIWMLLFWGGFILLAIWLITVIFPVSPQSPSSSVLNTQSQAREILDQRYVRGELTQGQYKVMRQTMERNDEI